MHFHRPASTCAFPVALVLFGLSISAFATLPAAGQLAYEVRIEGVDDAALLALMQGVSESLAKQNDPPASVLHLRRRASRDVENFTRVFESQGYYSGTISLQMERDATPVGVVFSAAPGPQYTLGEIALSPEGDANLPEDALPATTALGLVSGAPALADAIAGANAKILAHLRTHGFPAPAIATRDVVVDHATRQVNLTYHIQSGPAAVYGDARYEGLDRTRPRVVDRLLPWKEGDSYDQRQLTTLRTRLYDTGLFATASAEPLLSEIGDDGAAPIRVTVTERPPRTMTAGMEFKSDEGVGLLYGWEHRNIGGLGHRLSVNTKLATELKEVNLRYRIDRFHRLDQALDMSFLVAQEERDAYNSDRIVGLALVERTVSPHLTLGVGAGFRIGRVEQLGIERTHELFYFPLEVRMDQTDDPLDASRGFKFRTRVSPYVDPIGELDYFTKIDTELSHYLGWDRFETSEGTSVARWVLATRIHLGAIIGSKTETSRLPEGVRQALMNLGANLKELGSNVPADVRFYGGGGGSIRGYRFQTVSPLVENDPIGGASLAEFSIEIRRRLSESLGLVAFLDGGSAFEGAYPDFSSNLQFGAGVGVRYYTPLGPLRFDVAVPLNKRKEIDDAFQIYLSIGHAF